MKEAELETKVTETCNWLGLRWYHTHDSRKSNAGYPDLTIVGPRGVAFLELKADKGVVSPQQEAWIMDLKAAGMNAMVVRPGDFNHVVLLLKKLAGK